MFYFYVAIILVVGLSILISMKFSQRAQRKKIEKIRSQWGKRKDEYFNFSEITSYSQINAKPFFFKLSDQTIADIDFYVLFSFLDRTNSRIGQQFLYNRLIKPLGNISSLEDFNNKVLFFSKFAAVRENVQLLLSKLNNHSSYNISTLFTGIIFKKPKWYYLLIIDSILMVILAGMAFFYFKCIIAIIFLLFINSLFHLWNKNNAVQFIKTFPELNKLINTAEQLVKEKLPFDNSIVVESIRSLRTFQWKLKFMGYKKGIIPDDLSQIFFYVFEFIKSAFLIEIHIFFSITKELESKVEEIQNLFDYVGLIDTCISVASLRADNRSTCTPIFMESAKKMIAKKLVHPLIDDCVCNDITVDSKSVLITGSNMSGKTTFLRTVCINSILAQTIYTCFAESFETPIAKIFSSIRIEDNLLEEKSYFFEEAKIIESLINEVNPDQFNIFILDEVFKGTNTKERIAAGKAVMSYLNRYNNIVFLATHDLELATLLDNEFNLYHFTESFQNDNLYFDYKIKKGSLQSRNAIKILQFLKFPESIIQEAFGICESTNELTVNG